MHTMIADIFCMVFNNSYDPKDEINYKIPYAPVFISEIIYYWLFGKLNKSPKKTILKSNVFHFLLILDQNES